MSALYDRLVKGLGDLKIFRYPFWLVYDPSSYKVRGPEMRVILDKICPGDIVLRRYDGYLDGKIIPGVFSHAALFVGEVTETDLVLVPGKGRDPRFFSKGPQQITHSTAEGVHLEDMLTFVQNDGMAVLRLPERLTRLPTTFPTPVDLREWHPREQEIHVRLLRGEEVERAEVIALGRELALGLLGTEYDFAMNFKDGHRLSCTEYVAQVHRCAQPALGILPTEKGWLQHLLRKAVIEPDAFLGTVLERIHLSESARRLVQEKG